MVVSIARLESSFRALSFRRRPKEMKHQALFLQSVLKNLVLMDSMVVPYNSHKLCYLPSLNCALVAYLHVSSVTFDAYAQLCHFCCNQNDVNGQDCYLCCQLDVLWIQCTLPVFGCYFCLVTLVHICRSSIFS